MRRELATTIWTMGLVVLYVCARLTYFIDPETADELEAQFRSNYPKRVGEEGGTDNGD